MSDTQNPVSAAINWQFLNEPLYRWIIFFVALSFIAVAWRGVISFMKEAG
jgi:hypothetical protein